MKKPVIALALAATLAGSLFAASPALADNDREENHQTVIAAIGDWPYSQYLLDNAHLLTNSVNTYAGVDFVLHVGDLHSGSMPCTSAGTLPPISTSNPGWNAAVFHEFQQFKTPVVYTPGDNEWADCHKSKQKSSGHPLRELAAVRSLFFAKPGITLGREKRVMSQAEFYDIGHPEDSQFVENVMWKQNDVVFVTLNIPGGSNDDTTLWTGIFKNDTLQATDRVARLPANLRWLQAAFALAKRHHAKAVVVAEQADLWDKEVGLTDTAPAALANYTPYVAELATQALAFKRPVLLVNGDTHLFVADRPLADPTSQTGKYHNVAAVPNLQRLVVQGSTNDPGEWLRITIDPSTPEVFSWNNVPYCAHPSTDSCAP